MSKWPVAAGDVDFEPYLEGMPAASVALFWRFIDLARSAGPVSFELHNGPVVLRGTRRIFASVRVRTDGLAGHLNLDRELADRRIRRAQPMTRRLYYHRYRVAAPSDLDEEFAGWLREARQIGDGEHLSAPVSLPPRRPSRQRTAITR